MIVLIDNYDSFTYNLVDHLGEPGARRRRAPQRQALAPEALAPRPEAIVISPGPAIPTARRHLPRPHRGRPANRPLLGVCLGHQAIGQAFGGEVVRAAPIHGKRGIRHTAPTCSGASTARSRRPATILSLSNAAAFRSKDACRHRRYGGRAGDGNIAHTRLPVHGVQFHPESIASEHGHVILRNFLDIPADWNAATGRPPRGAATETNRERLMVTN